MPEAYRGKRDRESVQRLIASILANGCTACEPVTANVYLEKLDHFVTEKLGRGAYVRYMDDFVIFGSDKALLLAVSACHGAGSFGNLPASSGGNHEQEGRRVLDAAERFR